MVWALGFIPRVVSCFLKVLERHFHSSFPSSPRISDLAQSLAHSGMGSNSGDPITVLREMVESVDWERLPSLPIRPLPLPQHLSSQPRWPAAGQTRDFTQTLGAPQAQDCWPWVYTNSTEHWNLVDSLSDADSCLSEQFPAQPEVLSASLLVHHSA